MPRMQLVSQVAGALVAGALVFVLARQVGARNHQAIGAIAIVPIAIAGLLALPNLRDATVSLLDQRKVNAALTAEQAQLQGGVWLGVDVAFLGWAGAHFGEGDTFHLVVGDSANTPEVQQWALFQLGPHLAVEQPTAADWLVFYDSSPTGYPAGMLDDLEIYAPGFAVARNGLAR
jgi:hypothetical protein